MVDRVPKMPENNSIRSAETLKVRPTAGGAERADVPCLTLIYHPRLERVGERARISEILEGHTVKISRTEPDFERPEGGAAEPLFDRFISRRPLKLSKRGPEYWVEPAQGTEIRLNGQLLTGPTSMDASQMDRGSVISIADRVALLLHSVGAQTQAVPTMGMIGQSEGLNDVRRAIANVSDQSMPVLISGETGVGKEHVAEAIHLGSPRREKPFIAVNMATLVGTTASSELFGHVRGSFTGALSERQGLFARADGGTLFLDEIGEASEDVQALLLRVIETGAFLPVGADRERCVDVRVLAASDRNLIDEVGAGRLREALFQRLQSYEIAIPPLRDRRADIPLLTLSFLKENLSTLGSADRLELTAPDQDAWLPLSWMLRLVESSWPGNVRQLRNVIRKIAVSFRHAKRLPAVDRLESWLSTSPVRQHWAAAAASAGAMIPSDEQILETLEQHHWAPHRAAAALGVAKSTLYGWMSRSGCIRTAKEIPQNELEDCKDQYDGDLQTMARALRVSRRGLQLRMKALKLL